MKCTQYFLDDAKEAQRGRFTGRSVAADAVPVAAGQTIQNSTVAKLPPGPGSAAAAGGDKSSDIGASAVSGSSRKKRASSNNEGSSFSCKRSRHGENDTSDDKPSTTKPSCADEEMMDSSSQQNEGAETANDGTSTAKARQDSTNSAPLVMHSQPMQCNGKKKRALWQFEPAIEV